jgi:hypothetical protein
VDTDRHRATVVFEFSAHDIGEAGKRLNALFEVAEEHRLETRATEPSTAHGTQVTLSSVAPAARTVRES